MEHVARLAYRSYDIVSLLLLVACDVLYAVVCVVERRADEVCHAGVDNHELLVGALLDVCHFGDEAAALCDNASSWLTVQSLSFTQFEVLAEQAEVSFEVSHREVVRMLVVDAESAAYVYVLEFYALALELVLQLVDSHA